MSEPMRVNHICKDDLLPGVTLVRCGWNFRLDIVRDDEVYFVKWKRYGRKRWAQRMPAADFVKQFNAGEGQ